MFSPKVRRRSGPIPSRTALRDVTLGWRGWRREKARICLVREVARSAACPYLFDVLAHGEVERSLPRQQQIAVADHRGHEVVEVVGDASGELPHRLHLLRLAQLLVPLPDGLLGLLALRDVPGEHAVVLGAVELDVVAPHLHWEHVSRLRAVGRLDLDDPFGSELLSNSRPIAPCDRLGSRSKTVILSSSSREYPCLSQVESLTNTMRPSGSSQKTESEA